MEKKKSGWSVWGIHFSDTKLYYGDNGVVVILDRKGKEVERIGVGANIWSINVSDDERSLFLGCDDNTGRVIDLRTNTRKSVILRGHTHKVLCIVPCEDNDVYTGSNDMTIRRWNSSTGECIRTFTGHRGWVCSILCDRNARRVFSASADATIMVWNAQTGEKIGEMKGHGDVVRSIAFVNPTTIVSGSWDKTIKIWNTTTMICEKTFSSHIDSVISIAVTPDGQYVLSGSGDKTVKIHSVATGDCIASLSHHSDWVFKVAVSPDGRSIASGIDRTMCITSVSPPFPFVVHQGIIIIASTATNLRLLSDGTFTSIETSILSSTRCFLENPSRFTLQSSETNKVTFTAPSADDAEKWVEAINAVRGNLSLHPDQRASNSLKMIHRHRFDLLQDINFHQKRKQEMSLLPRDIMHVVGNYI